MFRCRRTCSLNLMKTCSNENLRQSINLVLVLRINKVHKQISLILKTHRLDFKLSAIMAENGTMPDTNLLTSNRD